MNSRVVVHAALLSSAGLAIVACSRHASATLEGIPYRLDLDRSYRLETLDRWHEHVWYSDRYDAPIVSIHVSPASSAVGEAPHCVSGRGVGWGTGFVFYPGAFDRPQPGESASLRFCSRSHPGVTVSCSVYFRTVMDRSRAEASIAPCRTLVVE